MPESAIELIEPAARARQAQRPADAHRALTEAVALCRAAGEPLALAHTLRHLGDLHQDAGRLQDAEPHYREALEIYRADAGTSALELANAIRPLAMLDEARGRTGSARELWSEARALYETAGVAEGVAECADRLGR
jgi:tetratricopeptide (TPR) repeat protein